MAYVARIIGPDERLIGVARLHWIYLAHGLGWFVFMTVVGAVADYYLYMNFGSVIPLYGFDFFGISIGSRTPAILMLFFAAGLVVLITHILKVLGTEVALTSRRIIYKTGIIAVEVEEIELEEIKGEHIDHGILGRFLKFGSLQFDCRFIGDIYLPMINRPYRFVKALHSARSKLEDSFGHVVYHADRHSRHEPDDSGPSRQS